MSVQATTWVWEHSKSRGPDRIVLLAIADAANREGGYSCQSIATLVKMSGVSESTVHRSIKALLESGELVHEGASARYRTNVYSLPMKGCQADTPPTSGVSSESSEGVTGDTRPQVTNPKEPSCSVETEPEPVQLTETDEKFAEFYSLYPRREARKPARASFVVATKIVDAECILAALRQQRSDLQRRHDDGLREKGRSGCPLPATWLNQERWNDEVTGRQVVDRDAPRQPGESRDQWLIRAGFAG